MSTEILLQATNVRRSLPLGERQIHILRDVSFQVAAGEWVALTGPSGSGKSTLLGVLGGIDRLTSGRVNLNGHEISALPEHKLARIRNEQIGVVFQAFHLIPSLTAQKNVELPLYISPKRREAADLARRMLELVGLGNRLHHLPNQLSGGEQQRVAIARALVNGPRLLLADEPTGNLDTQTGRQVLDLIADLRLCLGLTIIMVTHDPQVAALADRQLHLVDGQLDGSNGAHMPQQVTQ